MTTMGVVSNVKPHIGNDNQIYIGDKKFSLVKTLKAVMPDLGIKDFKALDDADKLKLTEWCMEDSSVTLMF